MIQRAELRRKLGIAGDALKPSALLGRGKYRVGEKIDDAAHAVRQEFRNNRLPIALAAAAGVAWLFREPIKEHVPKIGLKIRELATSVADRFHSGDDEPADEDDIEIVEEDDEAAE
ncbi:hypothetical protein [Sphingopyxis panaciterrae]